MPTFTGNPVSSWYKRLWQIAQSSNTGVDATTRAVQTGDGVNTSLSVSDDVLQVQPQTDDTTGTFLVKNQSGNNILTVDTDNSKVLTGASQVAANTHYAYFSHDSAGSGLAADYHNAIGFNSTGDSDASNSMGSSTLSSFNDTEPATTLAIGTTAEAVVRTYWYIVENITIDAVHWLHGADAATGDTTAAHLMAYTVDTANGSTSGDLSGGTVVADGANITNAGYEQIYYQSMTIQSADVDAGKVILFTFASDTINSDYTISATVKYHIR